MTYSCSLCTLKFEDLKSLNGHKRDEHLIAKRHNVKSCPTCNLSFKNGTELNIHRRTVHLWAWQKFQCPQCPTMEETVDGLLNHMKQEKHSLNQSMNCPRCWKTCEITGLASHYQECAKKSKGTVTSQQKVCCQTCGKMVQHRRIAEHQRSHLRAKGNRNRDDDSLYPHHCDKCGKRFSTPQGLRKHIGYIHEGIKDDVMCDICSMSFDRVVQLQRHKRTEHPTDEDDRYQCKICGKPHGTTTALRTHMRRHEEAKFKCSFCEKSLKSEMAWEAHERQHTGEKPFTCSVCGAGFVSNQALGQHKRGVHGIAARGGKTGWYRKEKAK